LVTRALGVYLGPLVGVEVADELHVGSESTRPSRSRYSPWAAISSSRSASQWAVSSVMPGSTEPATECAVELDGPIERTDVPTLLAVGPRTGSYTTTADLTGERFELLVHCVGGEVTVEIVGIATTPYQCTADGLGRPETYGAEFDLHEAPGEVTVAVTAGAATQWRLHLGLLPAP